MSLSKDKDDSSNDMFLFRPYMVIMTVALVVLVFLAYHGLLVGPKYEFYDKFISNLQERVLAIERALHWR
jgi:hypothetical protein